MYALLKKFAPQNQHYNISWTQNMNPRTNNIEIFLTLQMMLQLHASVN
jgi:hypothetical protein